MATVSILHNNGARMSGNHVTTNKHVNYARAIIKMTMDITLTKQGWPQQSKNPFIYTIIIRYIRFEMNLSISKSKWILRKEKKTCARK